MKDSGVAWIGDIPENWSIIRAKYTYTNANVGESIDKKYWSNENDDYVFYTAGLKSIHTNWGNFPKWKLVKENDLLLSRNGTPYVYFPTKNALYSDHIIRICINTNYDKRYVRYCLQRSIEHYIIDVVSIATWSISLWAEQNIIKPPLSQQKEIADYLDTKCAEIESIHNAILTEIETLEEYKKSVITEAVTKGLHPDVAMKDSGIEWIGEIPEHWCISEICFYSSSRSGGTPDRLNQDYWNNGTIHWMSSGEINKVFINDTNEYITELAVRNSSAKIIPAHSVMVALNGQGKTKGMSAVLNIDSACNQSLCAFQTDEVHLTYLYLFFCFQCMYKYLRYQVGDAIRDGLSASYVKKQRIPLPTITEQKEICEYCLKIYNTIDSIISDKNEQLKVLGDYKKSLIYEYVTGKRCLNIS